jgi:branched-chain amino acid transport system permease protein
MLLACQHTLVYAIFEDCIIQIIANGVMAGLTIALMALAFTTVYLPTRVFFVALGGVYTLIPFIAWSCLNAGFPWLVVIVICSITGMALSVGCEMVNHGPLDRGKASSTVHLVSSLGFYIVFVQVVALIWGNESKVLRTGLDTVVHVGAVIFTRAQIIATGGAILLVAGFFLWLKFSDLGLRFRALADNPVEMALRGHDTSRLRIIAFGLAGGFASAATMMAAFDIGFDSHGGLSALLLGVVAMIIGGRQSFLGPVIAGVALGMLRSGVVWYWSAPMQDAVTFALAAVFLVFRPDGLFAQKSRLEAST